MDERIIKQAVETIQLSDMQKQRLVQKCRETKKKKRPYLRALAAAASAAIVMLSGTWLWSGSDSKRAQESTVNDNHYSAIGDLSSESLVLNSGEQKMEYGQMQQPETSVTAEDHICVNELEEDALADGARIRYDDETYQRVTWSWQQAEQYYGRKLTVDPLPQDMKQNPFGGQTVEFILKRDSGTVVVDTVWMEYWNDWQDYETGGAKRLVSDGGRGFTVLASKVGMLHCGLLVPREQLQMSTIDGVEVMIGHRVFGTLYNEDGEPDYEYDVYLAQFTCNGVEYEVTADAMTLEEIVSIVKALIPSI